MLVDFLDNQVFEMLNYVLFISHFVAVHLLLIIKLKVIFIYVYHNFVGWLLLVFWYTDAIEDSVLEYVLSSRSKIGIKVQHFLEDIHKLWVWFIKEFFNRKVSSQLLLVLIPLLLTDRVQLFRIVIDLLLISQYFRICDETKVDIIGQAWISGTDSRLLIVGWYWDLLIRKVLFIGTRLHRFYWVLAILFVKMGR